MRNTIALVCIVVGLVLNGVILINLDPNTQAADAIWQLCAAYIGMGLWGWGFWNFLRNPDKALPARTGDLVIRW